jgi:hypothetical protein
MSDRLRSFWSRHPVLREAILWAIPALIFGAVLRLLLLHYSPYAYWGSDSRSYYSFAHKLLTEGYISLDEKRRFFYPIMMVPVSLLPGPTLKSLALFQHGLGLLSLIPLAYVVRKTLVHWRLWVVPVTVLYAGHPVILWYEHELLGETVFFAALLWAFAGWVAWVSEARRERALRLFWWFFVPLAIFLITKPSGRFIWPGIALALLIVMAWRRLDWRRWAALGALVVLTLFVGSKKQGAWLFYVATFPLTQLDSPLHAAQKAQIRDLVEPLQERLDVYYLHDDEPFQFLEAPDRDPQRTLWVELRRDESRRARIYMDLALEGVRSKPLEFLGLSLQRLVASANISEFKEGRFEADYLHERLEGAYEKAVAAAAAGKPNSMLHAFGLPEKPPLPSYPELEERLSPKGAVGSAERVMSWVQGYARLSDFVALPQNMRAEERSIWKARITPLGVWLLAGVLLALLPPYTRTLGVWSIAAGGFLVGFFLISQANPRYFAPAWPVLIVLLAVPADLLVRAAAALVRRGSRGAAPAP